VLDYYHCARPRSSDRPLRLHETPEN
jgi:hypothetical protein